MAIAIRPAQGADGPAMQRIEVDAGRRFADVGMPEIARDEGASLEELAVYANDARSFVATDEDGCVVAFVLVSEVDGLAHIDQISVQPEHQGRGIGRSLIDEIGHWARQRNMNALTLSTFDSVPWNRPLYEHLGFRTLTDSELGPELARLRASETALGLDPKLRVCMRHDLV